MLDSATFEGPFIGLVSSVFTNGLVSPGLLNWGPGAQHLFSNWSGALNSNCSIGGPEGPLRWVLVLSTASYLQLIWNSCRRGILLFYAHSIQPVDSQGYPLDTFDWMHLLLTQMHFLFWQLGRGQYATKSRAIQRKE